jgi:hypothetical protein
VVLKALSPGFEPFVVAAAEAAEAAGHGAAFDVTTMLGGFDQTRVMRSFTGTENDGGK